MNDSFWNIANPGWAYGLYYGITGPLLLGHATLFYEGGFSADSLCQIVDDYKVTNLGRRTDSVPNDDGGRS